jgi:hypothetical protein
MEDFRFVSGLEGHGQGIVMGKMEELGCVSGIRSGVLKYKQSQLK